MYLALLLFIYHRCYSLIESLKVIIVASALPMTCQTHRAPYVRSPPKTPVSGCFSVSQMALSPHDAGQKAFGGSWPSASSEGR